MEKVQVFLDYANIDRAARDINYEIDYESFLHDYLANESDGRFLVDAFAYVPIDPRQEHKMDGDIEQLWESGYFVNSKVGTIAGNTYKCDFDVELSMDVINIAHKTKPDIIILVSGDSDFIPIVKELRKMGIRVEVAAFNRSISKHLALVASGFIDIEQLLTKENDLQVNYTEEREG